MPLRCLFVDMNAYFASVEQQDDPRLRHRPVAVTAVDAPTTCILAASYEAKKFGLKTGMPVWEARKACPGLILRVGRQDRYTEVHHQIVKAVGRCAPVDRILSIDEMVCKLIGAERQPERATAIAMTIKREITRVGDWLKCSIGVGPNTLLAKVAGDMKKPDGLTFLHDADLPEKLHALQLIDFPGIGRRMEQRLRRRGLTRVDQLTKMSLPHLAAVWGSRVHAERWYHTLRGEDVVEAPTHRRTVGHSHVLPPDLRNDRGAHGVFSKLVHKAAARLRAIEYWTGALDIGARYEGSRWAAGCTLPHCQDTLALLRAFGLLWAQRPAGARPLHVWMVLSDLVPARAATPSLFPEDRQVTALSHAMDAVNKRFGAHTVRFGTVCGSEDTAPTRIAFSNIPEFNPAFGG